MTQDEMQLMVDAAAILEDLSDIAMDCDDEDEAKRAARMAGKLRAAAAKARKSTRPQSITIGGLEVPFWWDRGQWTWCFPGAFMEESIPQAGYLTERLMPSVSSRITDSRWLDDLKQAMVEHPYVPDEWKDGHY